MKCPKCHADNPEAKQFCADCGTKLSPGSDIRPEVTETLEVPVHELTTGSVFAGRYQVIEELGHGGMGRVYKVQDTKIGEKVALKLIRPEAGLDKKSLDRFSNELKLARKIRHKNVCQMFDLGEDRGTRYITMEYVHGEDLKQLIRKVGRLSPGQAVAIARQVCDGLEEAHRLGVIHRDLKPQNIMVDADGSARIMDFGIARSLSGRSITGAGVMIGTPEYMSPEQVEGKEVDPRSDIYSLGIILYEMLTGQVPFEGDTPFTIGMKQKGEGPRDPRELNDQISTDLSGIILKCLEKSRETRYASVEELDSDLAKIGPRIPTIEQNIPSKKTATSTTITVQFGLRKAIVFALVLFAVMIIGLGIWRLIPHGAPSVAVLPFKDLSPQKDQDYFCDGMTDALITNLSKVVRVISRTSTMQYKEAKKPLPQIAKELGVGEIVEGEVLRVGDKVRISAKLIHAASDQIQWTDTFERDLRDVLSLQSELAQAIVSGIRIRLTPQEQAQLTSSRRVNPEAYEAYLKARQEESWTNESIETAIAYLEQSIQKDPEFAPSFAALAGEYCSQAIWGLAAPNIVLPKAKEAVTKALELDSSLAAGHSVLGFLKWRYDWDFEGAEAEIKKAIALRPNSAGLHAGYAQYLSVMGRFDEAIKEQLMAEGLDPASHGAIRGTGWIYFQARRWDESIIRFKKALAIRPDQPLELALLGGAYGHKGADADSIVAAEKARHLVAPGKEQILDAYLAGPYSKAGKQAEVLQWIEIWDRLSTEHHLESFLMALMNAPPGNSDRAFDWLEKAYKERSVNMPFLLIHPLLDTLRSDRRFEDLVRRVGFPGH